MNNLLASNGFVNFIVIAVVALLITAIIVLSVKHFSTKQVTYEKKATLLTPTEKRYYSEFCSILGNSYVVLPQINLASVINKTSPGYRTELFRNVDFGIFDRDLRPLILIEINDATHLREDRAERDESVRKICKKARIPLITFWTKDGIDRDEIIHTLRRYL